MRRIISRTLRLLQLFSPEQPLWSVEKIAVALEVSTSSAYRYVQDLLATGFLNPVHGGYVLGPALIELDYLIRRHDPLIQAAAPAMRDLLAQTTQRGTIILCRRFRERVMCIHQEHGTEPHRPAGYERGVGMKLLVGATSRVILANEPLRVQRRLYLDHEESLRGSGLTSGWRGFSEQASSIRRAGYAESESEVTPGILGIAAPIFQGPHIAAAISLVVESADGAGSHLSLWRADVMRSARHISDGLEPATLAIGR